MRSIAHLIDVINSEAFGNDALDREKLGMPTATENALKESSLRLHLIDKNQGFGIVDRWQDFAKDKTIVSLTQRTAETWRSIIEMARAFKMLGTPAQS